MKENFTLIKFKDMETMFGQTVDNMKAFGKTIKCTVMVFLPGQMEENTKVNTFLIKNKEKESLFGLMDVPMKANGKMANNKVKVFINRKTGSFEKEFGRMVKRFVGLTIQPLIKEVEILHTNAFLSNIFCR